MPGVSLRSLIGQKSASMQVIRTLCGSMAAEVCIVDSSDKVLLGELPSVANNAVTRYPVVAGESEIGCVIGAGPQSAAFARLLSHLAERESEQRAMASETLTLYREIHLIEQLSEELAALLNISAISETALAHAKRLIPATHGAVFVIDGTETRLKMTATFSGSGDAPQDNDKMLKPDSLFIATVLDRVTAEIVNDCAADPRALGMEQGLTSLILAPLRSGQSIEGVIVLANTGDCAPYSAANLKLLNTIALQTGTAIRNATLCAEMVESAAARAAYTAELQAASSVQQMLLQSASRPTPGFHVDSVYLPASEVGGDFFFVQPGPNGSLLAIIGDVSGKGLTAAMRVSMILGVLRRETSDDPAEILFNLNNALVAQGQLGFTTACSMRISSTGDFIFANAGHISPYLSGVEMNSHSALPLGIVPDQIYQPIKGVLRGQDRIVLLSDGVPEARSHSSELFGFERLPDLTRLSAPEIASAAQSFGQEDDITVLALKLAQ
jgi:Stage II sporulation protein E (SpoIIE)/GAF domain